MKEGRVVFELNETDEVMFHIYDNFRNTYVDKKYRVFSYNYKCMNHPTREDICIFRVECYCGTVYSPRRKVPYESLIFVIKFNVKFDNKDDANEDKIKSKIQEILISSDQLEEDDLKQIYYKCEEKHLPSISDDLIDKQFGTYWAI